MQHGYFRRSGQFRRGRTSARGSGPTRDRNLPHRRSWHPGSHGALGAILGACVRWCRRTYARQLERHRAEAFELAPRHHQEHPAQGRGVAARWHLPSLTRGAPPVLLMAAHHPRAGARCKGHCRVRRLGDAGDRRAVDVHPRYAQALRLIISLRAGAACIGLHDPDHRRSARRQRT
jgi:hypothetical protein